MISGALIYACLAFYAFEKLRILNAQLANEGWKPIEILSANNYLDYIALYKKPTDANSVAILFVPDVKHPDSEFSWAFNLVLDCANMGVSAIPMTGVVTASLPHALWMSDQGSFSTLGYISSTLPKSIIESFCPNSH